MDNQDVYFQLGKRITALRLAAGYTIENLAQKADNMRPQTLERIEAGKFNVRYTELLSIARGLDMKLDFLPKE